ncbi:hypothetical protein ABRQ01_02785 [Pectobacterium aroidearum]|uniref:hypothetical protein n=1 Tax=Pectobacterium aroidearum TaxID=1201031 RepID=UPI0032EF93CA
MNIVNCERKIEEINNVLTIMFNDNSVLFFKKTNVIKPDFLNKELSFLRLISWLYTIYFETGKLSLDTIYKSMDLEEKQKLKSHKKVVQEFRTILQHNIVTSESSREFKMIKDCSTWTKQACGKNIPVREDDWMKVSEILISEAYAIFEIVLSTLEKMTDSPVKKEIFITNWNITVNKNVPAHLFDTHIQALIKFIDPENFDIVSYRSVNLESWRGYINKLDASANYELEVKKIVESSIIRDFIHIIPISIDELEAKFYLSKELFKSIYQYLDRQQLCGQSDTNKLLDEMQVMFKEFSKKTD